MEIYPIKTYESFPIFFDLYIIFYLLFFTFFFFLFRIILRQICFNANLNLKKLKIKLLIRWLPLLLNDKTFSSYLLFLVYQILDFYWYPNLKYLDFSSQIEYKKHSDIAYLIEIIEENYYTFYKKDKNITYENKFNIYKLLINKIK